MNEATYIHPFEKAGLGVAPFRFDGYAEIVFQIPGQAPRAGGSCDYCGTGIRDAFYVKSADGKRFKLRLHTQGRGERLAAVDASRKDGQGNQKGQGKGCVTCARREGASVDGRKAGVGD